MYRKTKIDNGIRVVTEKIPQVRSVAIGIWVKTGSRDEQEEENGISHFIEHMLFKGTRRRTALAIAKEIDSVGGVLNAFTSREFTSFYAKVLDKDFDLGLDLLSDIFLNSLFPLQEIERERGVIYQEIKMVEDTPDELVQDLFSQHVFSGHPLGFPIIGNYQSVAGVTRKELTKFFRNRFLQPRRIIVAAAGKLNHDEVVQKITETLGKIKPQSEYPASPSPELSSDIHIFPKDLEQVHLCMGTKGIAQAHPSRYAAFILNTLLGGSMSSRLFQEVREKRGLAYTVFSYLSSYLDTGLLAVYAGIARENLRTVVELVTKEFRRFKEKPLKKTELEKAKQQLKGNLLLSWESTTTRMSALAKGEIYFGKFIPFPQILAGIDRVSAAEVQGLAQELFQRQNFSLAAIGKVEDQDIGPDLIAL